MNRVIYIIIKLLLFLKVQLFFLRYMQCKIVENYIHVHQKRDPNNKKRIQISEIYYKRNKADLKSEDHLRHFVICDSHYFTIDVSDAFKSFTLYVK